MPHAHVDIGIVVEPALVSVDILFGCPLDETMVLPEGLLNDSGHGWQIPAPVARADRDARRGPGLFCSGWGWARKAHANGVIHDSIAVQTEKVLSQSILRQGAVREHHLLSGRDAPQRFLRATTDPVEEVAFDFGRSVFWEHED